jgi:hypothetical protein
LSTYGLPLNRIDAAALESLRADAVAEGRQLEYKEQLPGSDDESKREFLRGVTSFANSVGGDLICGVREARDAAGMPTGTPEVIVGLPGANLDQEKLSLESLLLNGIDPRIPSVLFHSIQRGAEPSCLLVRIFQSPLRLHMVAYKGMYRFYGRGASGRFQLDVGVRFPEGASSRWRRRHERVRRFRLDRVARVVAGETPIRIGDGPKLMFHALPLTSLDVLARIPAGGGEQAGDPEPVDTRLVAPPTTRAYNLDGFVAHTTRRDVSAQTYIQLFREKMEGHRSGRRHPLLRPKSGWLLRTALRETHKSQF